MVLGNFSVGLHGKITTLTTANADHIANTGAVHGATAAATANQLMLRDGNGRVNVVSPAASDDSTLVATTAYVQAELASVGTGSVTSVGTGTGLSGGPITTSGTINMTNTGVGAGSYTNTNLTVDAQGRITTASNGSAVTSVSGTAPITKSGTSSVTIGISAATTGAAGSMSSSDKSKLDNATQAATASRLMIRDASGRAEVANPASGNDIMNYTYWDSNRVKDVSDLTGITISTGAPTGGATGDIWFQY